MKRSLIIIIILVVSCLLVNFPAVAEQLVTIEQIDLENKEKFTYSEIEYYSEGSERMELRTFICFHHGWFAKKGYGWPYAIVIHAKNKALEPGKCHIYFGELSNNGWEFLIDKPYYYLKTGQFEAHFQYYKNVE